MVRSGAAMEPKEQKRRLRDLYDRLLEHHGPQGWWPILSRAGANGFDERGYHPGRYEFPKTASQRFEVILGALLTQNTSWKNAEKALRVLEKEKLLQRRALARVDEPRLAELVRASGYYQQKARKIRAMLEFFASRRAITRENLLDVWGVGPETVDSILLYAYHRPLFVVDAYTLRILELREIAGPWNSYGEVQALFHAALPKDVIVYSEYHALIVAHGKRYYSRKPYGDRDPLLIRPRLLPRGPERPRGR